MAEDVGERTITFQEANKSLAHELTTEIVQRLVVLNAHYLHLSVALPSDEAARFYEHERQRLERIVEDLELVATALASFERKLQATIDDGFLDADGARNAPLTALADAKKALADSTALVPRRLAELATHIANSQQQHQQQQQQQQQA